MGIKSILAKKSGLRSGLKLGLRTMRWGNAASAYPAKGVEYGNGKFIAINQHGCVALSSDNGATWTTNDSLIRAGVLGPIASVYSIKWANGKFHVLNEVGVVASSSDGINWSVSYDLADKYWANAMASSSLTYKVALEWNGSVLIATRGSIDGPSSVFATSTDGVTWTESSSFKALGIPPSIVAINGTNIVVVAAGVYGGGVTATSTDSGATWTTNTALAGKFTPGAVIAGAYSGSTIVIAYNQTYAVSTNAGATWTISTVTVGPSTVNCITRIGTKFLAGGTSGIIIESTDGITWSKVSTLTTTTWSTSEIFDIAWSGSAAVVFGSSKSVTARSTDGITWTYNGNIPGTVGTPEWLPAASARIAFGNGIYVAIGYGSAVPCLAISSDLNTWTDKTATIVAAGWPATIGIYNVYFKNNIFIIVGAGYIATSSNGITWSYNADLLAAGFKTTPSSLAYANGKYIIVAGGYYAYSTNLVNWTKVTPTPSIKVVASNGTKFVGVGASGVTFTSTDGITWSSSSQLSTTVWSTNSSVSDITWTGTKFIAVSSWNYIATSVDGVTWTAVKNTFMTSASYIYADPANPGFAVITNNAVSGTNNDEYVLLSTDNGVSWYSPFDKTVFTPHFLLSYAFFSVCVVNKRLIFGGSQSTIFVY